MKCFLVRFSYNRFDYDGPMFHCVNTVAPLKKRRASLSMRLTGRSKSSMQQLTISCIKCTSFYTQDLNRVMERFWLVRCQTLFIIKDFVQWFCTGLKNIHFIRTTSEFQWLFSVEIIEVEEDFFQIFSLFFQLSSSRDPQTRVRFNQ